MRMMMMMAEQNEFHSNETLNLFKFENLKFSFFQ